MLFLVQKHMIIATLLELGPTDVPGTANELVRRLSP